MLHLKKWGGMLGLFALVAVAGAASYQFLNSGKRPIGAEEVKISNAEAVKANRTASDNFNRPHFDYSEAFNDGNGINVPAKSAKAGGRDNEGTFIVLFKEESLAAYKGGNRLLPMSSKRMAMPGKTRLDVNSYESKNYVGYLQSQQRKLERQMSGVIGRSFGVRRRMQHAVNGVIVDVTSEEAARIGKMPEVMLVEAYREYAMDTDTGPQLIGAPAVWDGTNPGAPAAYRGENTVVGIIDSGINFGSPSFAATGPVDGYVHVNPFGAGTYVGSCLTDDAGRCNDKLIGGYDFVCGSPGNQCGVANIREEPGFGDTNGHGSHTASTSAGNVRDALYSGNTRRISGVAPHANIIAYDVCYTNISTGQGLCPNTSSVAAVNQAIADGVVDVINFSIGGGADPWSDAVSLAFLNAVDAGIYVAASAGNSGPAANTLGHNEPWVSSTAAAQHGRAGFSIAMQVTGPAPVPANLAPVLVNLGTGGVTFGATIPGTTPLLISSGIDTTSDGCAAYPANTFAGAIAVIRRGTCSFAIKTNNASAAGAVAVVIANNAAGVILPSVPGTTIPVFSVTQAEGDALRNFGQANPTNTTAQITFPALPLPNIPDVLGSFSSRGPAGNYNLLKPDVTAPGVSVLAAVSGTTLTGSENAVELYNGTSMASPHQAGSAALMRQARPAWTVPEIKSALSLTADQTVYLEDSITLANPFARGSGRIRVDRAINAGLVMGETRANYLAANPATGGEPRTLNQANLIERSCFSTCVFNRTFRNTGATATSWRVQLQGVSGSVTPIITVPGNGSLTLKVTVYAFSLLPNGNFSFGNLVLTPATGSSPVLRLPIAIAVQPPAVSVPASLSSVVPTNSAGSVSFTIANTGGSALNYTFTNSGTASGIVTNADNTGIASGFRNTTYTDPATAGSQAQYAADDFVLTESTQITSLFTQGFVVSGAALTTAAVNLTWSIYPDAAGLPAGNPQSNPAAAVWTYTSTPAGTGVTVTAGTASSINLNLVAAGQSVTLPPGRYWLVSNTRGTFANRWAQYGSNTASGNSGFASITVATNGTGAWVANPSFAGLSMRVIGNLPCGAAWISGTYATTGTLARGTSRSALTAINTTALAAGSYRANVCVQSNDPLTPSRAIPLSLTVTP